MAKRRTFISCYRITHEFSQKCCAGREKTEFENECCDSDECVALVVTSVVAVKSVAIVTSVLTVTSVVTVTSAVTVTSV